MSGAASAGRVREDSLTEGSLDDLPSGSTPNANTELTSSTSEAAAAAIHTFLFDGTRREERWRRTSSATNASDSHWVASSARGCGLTGVSALARATSAATA